MQLSDLSRPHLDASQRVLAGFSEGLSDKAYEQLEKVGVRIELGRRVTAIDDDGVSFGSDRLAAKTVIWAAGVRATGLIDTLDTETDRRTIIDGMKLNRRISRSPAFAKHLKLEREPGEDCRTDDELLQFARERGNTIFHPTSTCRMGPDERAVVDARLRVKGLRGLRVADCSIMPTVVSGNTNAPAIMIGEKCADLVLEDARS